MFFLSKGGNAVAEISVDGQVVRRIRLSELTRPEEFTVDTRWGSNVIRADSTGIAVIDADCPDKVCVETGKISNSAVPIVCLPHRLVVTVSEPGETDAVTGG